MKEEEGVMDGACLVCLAALYTLYVEQLLVDKGQTPPSALSPESTFGLLDAGQSRVQQTHDQNWVKEKSSRLRTTLVSSTASLNTQPDIRIFCITGYMVARCLDILHPQA